MDSEYVPIAENEIEHSGIKGMKWGIRRYQNKDGSLTPVGRKRYAEESEALKKREQTIKNRERTNAKISKLDAKKAELDAREAALKSGKTSDTEAASKAKAAADKQQKISDMSDAELQKHVNRLRNEDAYKDLSKKLGYDTPTTELDAKIADMKRQKEYLELQRDIKKLTSEQASTGKKAISKIMTQVVEPAAISAGKEVLTKILRDTGMTAASKVLGKEAAKAVKQAKKEAQEQATKEAKEEAKAAEKQAKKEAKQEAKQAKKEKVYEGTVEGFGKSSKTSDRGKKWASNDKVVDAEYWDVVDDDRTSSGRTYVSNYLALPAPKDDD